MGRHRRKAGSGIAFFLAVFFIATANSQFFSPSNVRADCTDKVDGVYAIDHCSQNYQICKKGIALKQSCSDGLRFNPLTSQCDFSVNIEACQQSFSCVGRTNGLYGEGCSAMYWTCIGNNLGRATCPTGTFFNTDTTECDYRCNIRECGGEPGTSAPPPRDGRSIDTTTTTTITAAVPRRQRISGSISKTPLADSAVGDGCAGREDGPHAAAPCSNSFLSCWAGTGYVMRCPENLRFNEDTQACDYAHNVIGCGEFKPDATSTTSTTTRRSEQLELVSSEAPTALPLPRSPDIDCVGRADGLYAGGCVRDFFRCVAGIAYRESCEDNLVFDDFTKACERLQLCLSHTTATAAASEPAVVVRIQSMESAVLSSSLLGFDCSTLVDGLYGEACNAQFLVCANGVASVSSCHDGLVFDAVKQQCEHPDRCGQPRPLEAARGTLTDGQTSALNFRETWSEKSSSQQRAVAAVAAEGALAFECGARSDGFYGSGRCLSSFVECVAGSAYVRECSRGLVFDERAGTCEYPERCVHEEIASTVAASPLETTTTNGRTVDPTLSSSGINCLDLPDGFYSNGCSRNFTQCVYGTSVAHTCPEGRVFIQERSQCDYPQQCTGREKNGLELEESATPAAAAVIQETAKTGLLIDCTKLSNGLYSAGCSHAFVECANGGAYPLECSAGLVFDKASDKCVWPEECSASSTIDSRFVVSIPASASSAATAIPTIFDMSNGNAPSVSNEAQASQLVEEGMVCTGTGRRTMGKCSSGFVQCIGGKLIARRCPGQSLFDESIGLCVYDLDDCEMNVDEPIEVDEQPNAILHGVFRAESIVQEQQPIVQTQIAPQPATADTVQVVYSLPLHQQEQQQQQHHQQQQEQLQHQPESISSSSQYSNTVTEYGVAPLSEQSVSSSSHNQQSNSANGYGVTSQPQQYAASYGVMQQSEQPVQQQQQPQQQQATYSYMVPQWLTQYYTPEQSQYAYVAEQQPYYEQWSPEASDFAPAYSGFQTMPSSYSDAAYFAEPPLLTPPASYAVAASDSSSSLPKPECEIGEFRRVAACSVAYEECSPSARQWIRKACGKSHRFDSTANECKPVYEVRECDEPHSSYVPPTLGDHSTSSFGVSMFDASYDASYVPDSFNGGVQSGWMGSNPFFAVGTTGSFLTHDGVSWAGSAWPDADLWSDRRGNEGLKLKGRKYVVVSGNPFAGVGRRGVAVDEWKGRRAFGGPVRSSLAGKRSGRARGVSDQFKGPVEHFVPLSALNPFAVKREADVRRRRKNCRRGKYDDDCEEDRRDRDRYDSDDEDEDEDEEDKDEGEDMGDNVDEDEDEEAAVVEAEDSTTPSEDNGVSAVAAESEADNTEDIDEESLAPPDAGNESLPEPQTFAEKALDNEEDDDEEGGLVDQNVDETSLEEDAYADVMPQDEDGELKEDEAASQASTTTTVATPTTAKVAASTTERTIDSDSREEEENGDEVPRDVKEDENAEATTETKNAPADDKESAGTPEEEFEEIPEDDADPVPEDEEAIAASEEPTTFVNEAATAATAIESEEEQLPEDESAEEAQGELPEEVRSEPDEDDAGNTPHNEDSEVPEAVDDSPPEDETPAEDSEVPEAVDDSPPEDETPAETNVNDVSAGNEDDELPEDEGETGTEKKGVEQVDAPKVEAEANGEEDDADEEISEEEADNEFNEDGEGENVQESIAEQTAGNESEEEAVEEEEADGLVKKNATEHALRRRKRTVRTTESAPQQSVHRSSSSSRARSTRFSRLCADKTAGQTISIGQCRQDFIFCRSNRRPVVAACPVDDLFDAISSTCVPTELCGAEAAKINLPSEVTPSSESSTVLPATQTAPPDDNAPFSCTGRSNGTHASAACSSVYYVCGSTHLSWLTCPDELVYDDNTDSCKSAADVDGCAAAAAAAAIATHRAAEVSDEALTVVGSQSTVSSTASSLLAGFKCTSDGGFATDCKGGYVMCSNGVALLRRCSAALTFDETIQACQYPSLVLACGVSEQLVAAASTLASASAATPTVDAAPAVPTLEPAGASFSSVDEQQSSSLPIAQAQPLPSPAAIVKLPTLADNDACEGVASGLRGATKWCPSAFVICRDGASDAVMNCPEGTFFDQTTEQCGYRQDVCSETGAAAPAANLGEAVDVPVPSGGVTIGARWSVFEREESAPSPTPYRPLIRGEELEVPASAEREKAVVVDENGLPARPFLRPYRPFISDDFSHRKEEKPIEATEPDSAVTTSSLVTSSSASVQIPSGVAPVRVTLRPYRPSMTIDTKASEDTDEYARAAMTIGPQQPIPFIEKGETMHGMKQINAAQNEDSPRGDRSHHVEKNDDNDNDNDAKEERINPVVVPSKVTTAPGAACDWQGATAFDACSPQFAICSNGKPEVFDCAAGFVFDKASSSCGYPQFVVGCPQYVDRRSNASRVVMAGTTVPPLVPVISLSPVKFEVTGERCSFDPLEPSFPLNYCSITYAVCAPNGEVVTANCTLGWLFDSQIRQCVLSEHCGNAYLKNVADDVALVPIHKAADWAGDSRCYGQKDGALKPTDLCSSTYIRCEKESVILEACAGTTEVFSSLTGTCVHIAQVDECASTKTKNGSTSRGTRIRGSSSSSSGSKNETVEGESFCNTKLLDGLYRDTATCSGIIQCFGGQAYSYPPCTVGLVFVEKGNGKGSCDYASKVPECANDLKAVTEGPSSICDGQPHGAYLADNTDCSVYYRCLWSKLERYNCPEGTAFNSMLTLCDYPHEVKRCKAG